jgi:type I restriction enzyme S subunit
LVTRTSVGKVAIADKPIAFSQDITALVPDPAYVDRNYLAYVLAARAPALAGRSRGATIKGVTREAVLAITVPLPSLAEQRLIAEVLDKAEAIRSKRQEAIGQLDVLAQSIFINMFGNPFSNPRQWRASIVGSVCTLVTDGEHLTPRRTSSGIKLLSARNIRDGYIDFDQVDFIPPDEYERIARRCKPVRGDILISCSGTIGRVASVRTDEPLALVRSAALLRPDTLLVLTEFLERFLRTPYARQHMLAAARASSQANLFQGPIRKLPVFVPPMELQDRFVREIRQVEGLELKLAASSDALGALCASLKYRAFPE